MSSLVKTACVLTARIINLFKTLNIIYISQSRQKIVRYQTLGLFGAMHFFNGDPVAFQKQNLKKILTCKSEIYY